MNLHWSMKPRSSSLIDEQVVQIFSLDLAFLRFLIRSFSRFIRRDIAKNFLNFSSSESTKKNCFESLCGEI